MLLLLGARGMLKGLFYLFFFKWLHLWHMKIPGLGVESELQVPAYTIGTARADPSCICDLCSLQLWQCWIPLNPLSEARDQTCILT